MNTRFTVITRTVGHRPDLLNECLQSLRKQTSLPDQVVLVHHRNAPGARPELDADLDDVGPFRITVHRVEGGHRGRPLNVGLDQADADYVCFLDDDDLALPNWIEEFERGAAVAPGRIIRSLTRHRPVRTTVDGRIEVTGPDVVPEEGRRFDLMATLTQSRTPICSIAVPVEAIRDTAIRFAEDLPALEDFHFLLRAASALGVHDTGSVTSIYRRWQSGEATSDVIGSHGWESLRWEVFQRLDTEHFRLPPGSVTRIVGLYEELATLRRQTSLHRTEIRRIQQHAGQLAQRLKQIENSTSWRITAPIRMWLDRVRGTTSRQD